MDPVVWLRDQGFDPEGDLSKAIQNKRWGSKRNTAMYAAAEAGEIGVCCFLWEHGAASTIRTKNCFGDTPMLLACEKGHLDVAKWLFKVGAAEDIRVEGRLGFTPMRAACRNGFLGVAKWLFEMGAAEDVRTRDWIGDSPISAACTGGHFTVSKWLFDLGAGEGIRAENNIGKTPLAKALALSNELRSDAAGTWLILHGAAHVSAGRVDQATVQSLPAGRFIPALRAVIDMQAHFVSILAAIRFQEESPTDSTGTKRGRAAALKGPALLCGHEKTLLPLIADFAGVVRGRQLRNAREVLATLTTLTALAGTPAAEP